jgi:hypothetical protein
VAAPINLKANTPGGNSYKKSASAQKPYHGKPAPKASKPALRTDKGAKTGGTKPAYSASKAVTKPKVAGVNKATKDYTSAWMQSHGLKFAQNAGNKSRLPWANVPADGIGAASSSLKKTSRTAAKPNPAKRTTSKSSSATTKSRVKTAYTGKSFKVAKRSKVIGK